MSRSAAENWEKSAPSGLGERDRAMLGMVIDTLREQGGRVVSFDEQIAQIEGRLTGGIYKKPRKQ